MKRAILPILTLALGIGIGVMAGGSRLGRSMADGRTGSTGGPKQHSTRDLASPGSVALLDDFLDARSPADLTAEEALRLLLPWLTRDPFDESYKNTLEGLKANNQFKLLMDSLPLPVMEQLLDLARKRGLPLENTRDIFAAWAVRDWDKAMAWTGSMREKYHLRSAAIALLAESDPDRAEVFYQEILLKNPMDNDEGIVARLSKHHARQGQAAFFAFLDTLPEISDPAPYRLALDNLPAADVPAFFDKLLERQAEGEWVPINGLVGDLANKHPEQFKQWADKLPPEARNRVKVTAALNLNYRGREADSRKLLGECLADMAGQEKDLVIDNAATFANSPALVAEVLRLLPDDQKPTPEELAPDPLAISREDLTKPWTLVKFFATPEDQSAYLVNHFGAFSTLDVFNNKDFEILSHRLRQLGLTGEPAEKARLALEQARQRMMEERGTGGEEE